MIWLWRGGGGGGGGRSYTTSAGDNFFRRRWSDWEPRKWEMSSAPQAERYNRLRKSSNRIVFAIQFIKSEFCREAIVPSPENYPAKLSNKDYR